MFTTELIEQLAAELQQAEQTRTQVEHFSKRFPGMTVEDALGFFPEDRLRWVACRDARLAAVVRAWLEANDVEPSTEPPRWYR